MITVICEKTGLTFETESKRTKNHPAIMSIVNKANKERWYNECLDALAAGRAAKLDTIEQFVDLLKEVRQAALEQRDARIQEYLDRKRRDKERRAALYQAWREGKYQYPCNEDNVRDDIDQADLDAARPYVAPTHDFTEE